MGRRTNKQRRETQAATARERAAAARAEQRRREQRRRAVTILSSVVAVAVVVVIVAIVAINGKSNDKSGNRIAADPAVVKLATSLSPATFTSVGQGSAQVVAKKISDPPLTSAGKPELLFVGAEFCPYCAAERWSLVTALSRFGTFSNLSEVHSATNDGNFASFSFHDAHYTSPYLTLVAKEQEDRDQKPLDKLTSAENTLFTKYTTGYPFLYFGGQYVQTTQNFDPSVLGTKTQKQIASQLNNPKSAVTKSVIGGANDLTATICKMTGNKPANVCLAPDITTLQTKIAS